MVDFGEDLTLYQKAIEDITKRMGAGMAKFICKEVETVDDYNEYCHYVAGLVGLGLSELFHASGLEDMAPECLSNSMGLFLQKTNIIRDYLEDINEIPKSRMFWPRQIWNKYADKLEVDVLSIHSFKRLHLILFLEKCILHFDVCFLNPHDETEFDDLKYEKNSVAAVKCLNEMVSNALMHAEDCLKYLSALRDLSIFRFCAIPQIMAIGTLALCYNNLEVFRGVVKMRRGLTAKVIDQTRTMSDVYGAFYDFSCMLKAKVSDDDPDSDKTKNQLEAIQKTCRDSGKLNASKILMALRRRFYLGENKPIYSSPLVAELQFWSPPNGLATPCAGPYVTFCSSMLVL
ncbi:squalene synthetase-like protein [Asimina triloba]